MLETLSVLSIVFFISLPFLAVGLLNERWPDAPQFTRVLVWIAVFLAWGLFHGDSARGHWFSILVPLAGPLSGQ
jgi:hypothetical protein